MTNIHPRADAGGELVKPRPARLASGGAALARDAAAAAAGSPCISGGSSPSPSSGRESDANATGLVLAWSAASPLDDTPRRGFTHLYGVRLRVGGFATATKLEYSPKHNAVLYRMVKSSTCPSGIGTVQL